MSINKIKKLPLIIVLVVLGIVPGTALALALAMKDGGSEPNGVYCEINKVKLFALSTEDCQKAGGTVTHTVTTTVKPSDNDDGHNKK